MSVTTEVQSGLEGVVAFATEIAEPDREGGALRYRGVNIEELTTGVSSASFSGERLFKVTALVRAPSDAAVDAMRTGLETLGNELMVDIHAAPEA